MLLRDIAVALLGLAAPVLAWSIPVEQEEDEDLAWVDREIAKCEEGPRSIFMDTPEMAQLRNERLARLQKMRKRLLGEEAA